MFVFFFHKPRKQKQTNKKKRSEKKQKNPKIVSLSSDNVENSVKNNTSHADGLFLFFNVCEEQTPYDMDMILHDIIPCVTRANSFDYSISYYIILYYMYIYIV